MAPDRRAQKRNLRLFAIARSDINEALNAARILQRNNSEASRDPYLPMKRTIYFPVLHAMVISYSRPFVPTRTAPRLQGRWARFEDRRLQETHELVISMRNDFVAHSDEEKRRVTVYPHGSFKPRGFPTANTGLGISTGSIALAPPTIDAIIDCCMDIGRRLNEEVQRLLDALYASRTDLPTRPFLVTDDDGL
jgi:hypothetical protein